MNKDVEVNLLAFEYSASDTDDPRREGGTLDSRPERSPGYVSETEIPDFIGNLILVVSVVFSC
jgi:hypothetical protein